MSILVVDENSDDGTESIDNERSLLSNSDEIIKLLRAILSGIEVIANQDNLIDNIEE